MSEELKPCPFCGNAPQIDQGLVSCPLCRMTWIPPNMWNTRAYLARPAPAEGAVREAALREAAGIAYRMPAYVDNFNETDSMGRMLPGSPYDRGRYDASNEILAALSSPEDATPAAPVSVEEAARIVETAAECDYEENAGVNEPDWEDLPVPARRAKVSKLVYAALAQQDRRAALREMQSIREEMEQESGA